MLQRLKNLAHIDKATIDHRLENLGNNAVEAFHVLGLFVIGGTIVWSAIGFYFQHIMSKPHADLDDILMMFIYLELGAMVGIFFRTHRLPVIFLLFISMTALTRYLAIDLKGFDNYKIMTIVAAILVLSVSAFILRISESKVSVQEEMGFGQDRHDLSDSSGTKIS